MTDYADMLPISGAEVLDILKEYYANMFGFDEDDIMRIDLFVSRDALPLSLKEVEFVLYSSEEI